MSRPAPPHPARAVAPPGVEPVQGNCTDGPPSPLNAYNLCFSDGALDATALFTMMSDAAAAPLLAALQGGSAVVANFTEVQVGRG